MAAQDNRFGSSKELSNLPCALRGLHLAGSFEDRNALVKDRAVVMDWLNGLADNAQQNDRGGDRRLRHQLVEIDDKEIFGLYQNRTLAWHEKHLLAIAYPCAQVSEGV